jgi:hypothetical protein
VLYDLDEIATRTYHLTGEPDLFLLREDKANEFAREYLLSEDRYKYVIAFINDPLLIKMSAKEYQIHPSVIYNFYCYDTNSWIKYSRFFPDVNAAISVLNTNPFDKVSLQESITEIKSKVFNVK